MNVAKLCENAGFVAASIPHPEREVNGAYCGDLLSWVMGRACKDNAWITIMSNINVIAVATLADVSCVIICENVKLDEEVLNVAKEKKMNILLSKSNAYDTAVKISGII